jgi:Na+/melibiose symporter-like transporter
MRFLRERWLTLAILICAAAFVPLILGFVQNNNKGLVYLGVGIFMAGILFALICVILVTVSTMTRKREPARQQARKQRAR